MNKLIGFLVISFLFTPQVFAKGFVEAQMNYTESNPNKKDFNMQWFSESQTALIEMGLSWHNFRDDWHLGGFDLSTAEAAYIAFPELTGNCKLVDNYKGDLNGVEELGGSVGFMIKGSDCEKQLSYFKMYGMTISFYNVKALSNHVKTQVLRLYITDQPTN